MHSLTGCRRDWTKPMPGPRARWRRQSRKATRGIAEVGCLRINDMRAGFAVATGTRYHVMSFDITRCPRPHCPKIVPAAAMEASGRPGLGGLCASNGAAHETTLQDDGA